MWQFIYSVALRLAEPIVRRRLRRRARAEPAYGERVAERFGAVPEHIPSGPIWFHTVSAGETIAATPLIAQLTQEFPELPFLVTTMTPTGSAQVQERLGERVYHCYAPYDFAQGVQAFYERLQPRLLVLMETELWPNLIAGAYQRDIPVLLVNGRLSEKSARGYARVGGLTRRMLRQLALIACQEEAHRQRFVALGARPERVLTAGNLKFDQQLPPDYAQRLQRLYTQLPLKGRWIWIAASTHVGEDEQALAAHRQLCAQFPDALLLLVPRHPVRAQTVVELAAAEGLQAVLQSALAPATASDAAQGSATPGISVLVCDTMGQLGLLYGLAEVAFVGGSLVPHGGHNPIEPALCRCPIVMGPSRHNFVAVCEAFDAGAALVQVEDADGLAAQLLAFAEDPASASRAGARALAVVEKQRGAQDRLLEQLRPRLRQQA